MMTNDEAIKTLREDYCGNRIICELYPDQCNREDCEIWLAIKALETQPDGNCISRRVAISAITSHSGVVDKSVAKRILAQLPSAQFEPCEDVVSREYLTEHIGACWMNGRMSKPELNEVLSWINDVPSVQPEVAKDTNVPNNDCISRHVAIDALDSIGSLDTDADREYARDIFKALPSAQPEETCDTCKYGYFWDGMCDYCRVRYPSHYERRADER